jgi:hypothetical protein
MKPDYLFWAALAAYALHILEEYSYDWKTWAQKIMKLDVAWNMFYVTNAVLFFFGLCCAEVGWAHPTFSLILPALMLVNAVVGHVIPYVRSKRKFSPGMITGIFLFLPIGIGSFNVAVNTGVQTKALILAGICGILLTMFPVFLLKTKNLDFFKP